MILRRYVISEILKPTVAILFVLIAVFASYSAVTYLAEAVGGALPAGTVGLLVALKVAMALEVLLPTTFFLAVILALGRLYQDSEMTAFSACGVGLSGILRAVFLLSLPVAAVAALASLALRPQAYEDIYRIRARAQTEFDVSRLEPDHFLEMRSGRFVFFADETGGSQKGAGQVFIRVAEGERRKVIRAERMTQSEADKNGGRTLFLEDGFFYDFPLSGEGGKITRFERAEYPLLEAEKPNSRHRRKAVPTSQLIGSGRLEDIAELQWRLSTPLTTILLALLGVPLSRSNPRQGKYAKMGAAIVVFALYYQLFVIAKTWVEKGFVATGVGIWWVPALLAALTVILLWRTGEVFYRRPR